MVWLVVVCSTWWLEAAKLFCIESCVRKTRHPVGLQQLLPLETKVRVSVSCRAVGTPSSAAGVA